jgi:hypothetical protein
MTRRSNDEGAQHRCQDIKAVLEWRAERRDAVGRNAREMINREYLVFM